MRQSIFTLAVVLGAIFFAAPVRAQDSVKLKDGQRLAGDVLKDDDQEVKVVNAMGEVRTIPKADVQEVRRGTPLDGRVAKWLAAVDSANADQVFGVAEKAAKDKSLALDAKRLARRAIALNPEHAGARAFLGHVKGGTVWYADAVTARKAMQKDMEAKGYVLASNGFVKAAEAEDLKQNPGDWQLTTGMLWRKTADILREQGKMIFASETYTLEEEPLVKELKALKEKTGDEAHAAQRGACRVYSVLGKKSAEETAEKLVKTREWFVTTFKGRAERMVKEPLADFWVLSDQAPYEKFLDGYKDRFKVSDSFVKLSREVGSCPYEGLSRVVNMKMGVWENILVSGTGSAMMVMLWNTRTCPDWLPLAAGHHAEIAILGSAKVQYVAVDEYGRKSPSRDAGGRDISAFRSEAKGLLSGANALTVRQLFGTKVNEMTAELDTLGVVVMAFLLEQKNAEFLQFIKYGSGKTMDERFQNAFKMTFEALDQALKTWV